MSPPVRAAAAGEDAATVPTTRAGTVRPLEWVHAVGQLAMPSADTGEGILFVNATPWGTVIVDGFELGETPQEVRLPAGRHRVRVARPNQRGVESEVTVEAGRRTKFLR